MRPWLALAFSTMTIACGPATSGPQAPVLDNRAPAPGTKILDAETARLAALTPGQPDGVYLGASLAEVTAARPAMRHDASDDIHHAMIDVGVGEIVEYTYYFTEEGEQRLYEVIARHADAATAAARFDRDYRGLGAIVADQRLPTVAIEGLAFPVRAWLFEDKLVLIGVFPGSAWSGDDP